MSRGTSSHKGRRRPPAYALPWLAEREALVWLKEAWGDIIRAT
jgi:hypothetical protein